MFLSAIPRAMIVDSAFIVKHIRKLKTQNCKKKNGKRGPNGKENISNGRQEKSTLFWMKGFYFLKLRYNVQHPSLLGSY